MDVPNANLHFYSDDMIICLFSSSQQLVTYKVLLELSKITFLIWHCPLMQKKKKVMLFSKNKLQVPREKTKRLGFFWHILPALDYMESFYICMPWNKHWLCLIQFIMLPSVFLQIVNLGFFAVSCTLGWTASFVFTQSGRKTF